MLEVIHKQNIAALEWAQRNHDIVHVTVALGVDNQMFDMAQPPVEFMAQIPMAEDTFLNTITLSLGGSACKYSGVDEDTQDIVYDVKLGRPFLGNIPAGHIMAIRAGATQEELMQVPTPIGLNYVLNAEMTPSGDLKAKAQPEERPVDAPKRQAFKPTLVK